MSKVYSPGDNVINDCEPFVIQVFDNERDKRCHYCLIKSDNLKRCSQCHQVQYCSKKCQSADWEDIHKFKECKLYKAKVMIFANHCDRLKIRLILKVTFDPKSKEKAYKLWDNTEVVLDELTSHQDKFKPKDHVIQTKMCHFLVKELERLFNKKVTFEELWRLNCILDVNYMKVGNGKRKDKYAYGLYVQGASLPYDCHPSCFLWFYGRKLQVRAMRTIDTSVEQPTMDCIDYFQDRQSRRRALSLRFIDDCLCKRCVNNDDKDVDYSRYQYLENNERPKDLDFWDELLELMVRICGPHNPRITLAMYGRLMAFQVNNVGVATPTHSMLEMWAQLAKDVEKEFLITHGRQHPDYNMILDMSCNINLIAAKLKTVSL